MFCHGHPVCLKTYEQRCLPVVPVMCSSFQLLLMMSSLPVWGFCVVCCILPQEWFWLDMLRSGFELVFWRFFLGFCIDSYLSFSVSASLLPALFWWSISQFDFVQIYFLDSISPDHFHLCFISPRPIYCLVGPFFLAVFVHSVHSSSDLPCYCSCFLFLYLVLLPVICLCITCCTSWKSTDLFLIDNSWSPAFGSFPQYLTGNPILGGLVAVLNCPSLWFLWLWDYFVSLFFICFSHQSELLQIIFWNLFQ